jgi:hypothetical protein
MTELYKGVDYSDSGRTRDRRRALPGTRKTWQVGQVWELHEEIKRRILLGQKNVDVAEAVNCTPQTVSNVRNSPVIQDELALMKGARDAYTVDIARDIQEFAPKALELLKQVINGTGEAQAASMSLRTKSAESWLDRAGHGAIRKEAVIHQHLTKEEILSIRERALGPNSPVIPDLSVIVEGEVVEA